MKTLYILTDQKHSTLHPDDKDLPEALLNVGIQAQPVVWDLFDPPQDCQALIRTPWDYALKADAFAQCLQSIENANGQLINDYKTVSWNLDKSYMLDLEKKGMSVVPTQTMRQAKLHDIKALHAKFPLVIKPLIGCAGRDTYLLNEPEDLKACAGLEGQDILIQPFIPSIKTKGEYSFVFFDTIFSHAVVKNARPGEFRVQDDHGGTVSPYTPTVEEIKSVTQDLETLGRALPYARVDLVEHGGQLLIMELELIEPELFFRFSKNSINLFAEAISKTIL